MSIEELPKEMKHTKIILKEMARRVNAPYKDVNSGPDWYTKYEWTEEEQDNFKTWLMDYMQNSEEARIELMSIPSKRKDFLEKFVNMFLLNYGWKLK